ncbi:MAG: DJ-1/PfpI family protein [Methermicoccaceae archaeon]
MRDSGIKLLMVIAPEDFRDEEFLVPRDVFESYGISVVVASTKYGEVTGMLGTVVSPDISIADIEPQEFDGIVVVGGGGSRQYLWNNPTLHEVIWALHKQNKTIAAICISPVVLALAGILDQTKATVFPDEESIKELEKGGALYIPEHVVVSGNVITADGPQSAKSFALEVVHNVMKPKFQ